MNELIYKNLIPSNANINTANTPSVIHNHVKLDSCDDPLGVPSFRFGL